MYHEKKLHVKEKNLNYQRHSDFTMPFTELKKQYFLHYIETENLFIISSFSIIRRVQGVVLIGDDPLYIADI